MSRAEGSLHCDPGTVPVVESGCAKPSAPWGTSEPGTAVARCAGVSWGASGRLQATIAHGAETTGAEILCRLNIRVRPSDYIH